MTVPLAIRPGVPDDLGAITCIDPMTHLDAGRRAQVTNWLATGRCHVACENGQLVGFVALTEFFHRPFIELLFVAEPCRRRGVAAALVRHCLGRTAGSKLFVSTNQSNKAMQTLAQRLGFVQCGLVEHIDDGDPELFFVHLPER